MTDSLGVKIPRKVESLPDSWLGVMTLKYSRVTHLSQINNYWKIQLKLVIPLQVIWYIFIDKLDKIAKNIVHILSSSRKKIDLLLLQVSSAINFILKFTTECFILKLGKGVKAARNISVNTTINFHLPTTSSCNILGKFDLHYTLLLHNVKTWMKAAHMSTAALHDMDKRNMINIKVRNIFCPVILV